MCTGVILLVEDEPLIRMHLAQLLEDQGYGVVLCGDAQAAISEISSRDELAGLVSDINLGTGSSGWAVARCARQIFPDIAVVYITGDGDQAWSAEGVPGSMLLRKPFADAQITAAINNLINQSG